MRTPMTRLRLLTLALASWSGVVVCNVPSEVITSAVLRPAFAAGVPDLTPATSALSAVESSEIPR